MANDDLSRVLVDYDALLQGLTLSPSATGAAEARPGPSYSAGGAGAAGASSSSGGALPGAGASGADVLLWYQCYWCFVSAGESLYHLLVAWCTPLSDL